MPNKSRAEIIERWTRPLILSPWRYSGNTLRIIADTRARIAKMIIEGFVSLRESRIEKKRAVNVINKTPKIGTG